MTNEKTEEICYLKDTERNVKGKVMEEDWRMTHCESLVSTGHTNSGTSSVQNPPLNSSSVKILKTKF